MVTLIIFALIAIVALSFLTALVMHTQPPHIGFMGDLFGALLFWTLGIFGVGALVFGIIRLVRMAWGGAP